MDALSPFDPRVDLAELVDRAVAALADSRLIQILAERLFADDPATLQRLGDDLGLTRERVRQLEARARRELMAGIAANRPVVRARTALSGFPGTVCPLDDVIARLPALAGVVRSVDQPVWRVFDRLDETMEIVDGWCVRPTRPEATLVTRELLDAAADDHGAVPLARVDVMSPWTTDPAEATQRWLTYCGVTLHAGFALTQTRSVADHAAGLLSLAGRPLSSAELAEAIDGETNDRSLRNRLTTDARFDRVDRDKWALHEWGLEVYAGLRQAIGLRLDRNGGSMPLADLIEELTGAFSVTETSVVAYATAPPYRCRHGVVTRAVLSRRSSKTPEKTARLFRVPGGWAFRIRVNLDHRRGSGSAAPVALAMALGLPYGQPTLLDSPLGPQSLYWSGNQPSFGSIRRFILASGAEPGSEAFLILGHDNTFGFEVAGPQLADPLAETLRLIHAPATDDPAVARRALAEAIGLDATSTRSELVTAYHQRGDDDIAVLLTRAWDRLGPD